MSATKYARPQEKLAPREMVQIGRADVADDRVLSVMLRIAAPLRPEGPQLVFSAGPNSRIDYRDGILEDARDGESFQTPLQLAKQSPAALNPGTLDYILKQRGVNLHSYQGAQQDG